MQPPSVPRINRGHHDRVVIAAQARPQWRHGFCIPRKICNEKINPTHHHECKNARHRDSAPTALTANRYH